MIASADWMDHAACRDGEGRTAFFGPDDDDGDEYAASRAARQARAKAVCARCPVTAPCLALAIATHDRWSVSGAMTPAEREKYQRRTRPRPGEADLAA